MEGWERAEGEAVIEEEEEDGEEEEEGDEDEENERAVAVLTRTAKRKRRGPREGRAESRGEFGIVLPNITFEWWFLLCKGEGTDSIEGLREEAAFGMRKALTVRQRG